MITSGTVYWTRTMGRRRMRALSCNDTSRKPLQINSAPNYPESRRWASFARWNACSRAHSACDGAPAPPRLLPAHRNTSVFKKPSTSRFDLTHLFENGLVLLLCNLREQPSTCSVVESHSYLAIFRNLLNLTTPSRPSAAAKSLIQLPI